MGEYRGEGRVTRKGEGGKHIRGKSIVSLFMHLFLYSTPEGIFYSRPLKICIKKYKKDCVVHYD